MDVIAYLLELIATHKTVGIAGLGTFYKKKVPGRYDSESHAFLPPAYRLEFTSELTEHEALANAISLNRNISSDSANYYINEFANDVRSQLTDFQKAVLLPLGTLKIVNDKVIFEAAPELNLGFDFYGLPPVAADTPDTAKKEMSNSLEEHSQNLADSGPNSPSIPEKEAPDTIEEPAQSPVASGLEKQEIVNEELTEEEPPKWVPNYDDYDDQENNGQGKRIFLKTLLVLLLIAISGAVVYFVFPEVYDSIHHRLYPEKETTQASITLDSNEFDIDSARLADSLAWLNKPLALTKDSLKADSLRHTTVYEVIGSAMKSEKKVNQVIANLAKRGIMAKKMESLPGRLIKVSLGTFTDYGLAKKYQDSLKIKLKNPEIYIQTIKPHK